MRPITSNRPARRLLTTSTLAQLPLATLSIALLVHTAWLTGSVATAGLVSGAYAAALGVGGPVVGRLADRRGQTGLLVAGAGASAVLLLAIALLPAGTSAGVIAGLAAVLGVCTPPVAACLRAALPDVVADPGQLRSVISLQATLSELAWIAGPPLTLGVAAVVSTRAALMVAAGGLLLGTAAFAREPASRAWRPALERGASRGALAAPGMRTLTIALTAVGIVFGAVEVGVATGQGAGAGPLLGLWGAGSLLGGVAATRLGGGARTPAGLAAVLAALAAGHLALALAGGSAMAVGVLLVVAGSAIAPTYATVYAMVDDIAPKGTLTEGPRGSPPQSPWEPRWGRRPPASPSSTPGRPRRSSWRAAPAGSPSRSRSPGPVRSADAPPRRGRRGRPQLRPRRRSPADRHRRAGRAGPGLAARDCARAVGGQDRVRAGR